MAGPSRSMLRDLSLDQGEPQMHAWAVVENGAPLVRIEAPTPGPTGRGRRYPRMAHGSIRLHNMVDTAANAVRDLAADLRRLCGTGAVRAA